MTDQPPVENAPVHEGMQQIIHHESGLLAQDAYARFRENYEVEHSVALADWTALDINTQARWRHMLMPVAELIVKADEAGQSALFLEEEHRRLRERYNRDSARLAELETLVASVSERLPDAALLANLPAPLLAALSSLNRTAMAGRAPVPTVGAQPTESPASATAPASPPATATSAPCAQTDAPAAPEGPASVTAGVESSAASESPSGAMAPESHGRFATLSPELVAELEAAASAFAAEVASIKQPLSSETGTRRVKARVRANASQMLVTVHRRARDHLLKILGTMLTEDQRASLWPLPDDVFSVTYDVTAILETINVARTFAVFEVPPPGDDERSPKAWARVERVKEQLSVAGLADLHEYTDAQLGQVGRIVAEVLGLDVDPAAQVALGNAGIHFTRALASVRKTTG